jgi:hypothetical protein
MTTIKLRPIVHVREVRVPGMMRSVRAADVCFVNDRWLLVRVAGEGPRPSDAKSKKRS